MHAADVPSLEIRGLAPEWEVGLRELCRALEAANERRFFAPHPFDEAELQRRVHYRGLDHYSVVVLGSRVCGYGLLRGWDEGFTVPSLGLAIHPAARGRGLAELLMVFLHAVARHRGAQRVRLRVQPDNTRALALYRRLGYAFEQSGGGLLVGFKELSA
jgi:[ribosomal protein S18]-alanine N-acetyltransferase